jgi:hypothetical protein
MERRLWTSLIALLLLTACGDSPREKAGATGDTKASSARRAEEALLATYNASVSAVNSVSEPIERNFREYTRQIDPDRGPTGRERGVNFHSIEDGNTERALAALKEALSKFPGDELLDRLAKQYSAAAETLYPVSREAHAYYDRENWRDDTFAKGKHMHPELRAAYHEFLKRSDALRKEVHRIGDEQQTKELEQLAAKGLELRHGVLASLRQARAVAQEWSELPQKPAAADLNRFNASIEAAAAAFERLKTLAAADKTRAVREFGNAGVMLGLYLSVSESFVKDAKSAYRASRDQEVVAKGDGEAGRYSGVAYRYSELVTRYNALLQ